VNRLLLSCNGYNGTVKHSITVYSNLFARKVNHLSTSLIFSKVYHKWVKNQVKTDLYRIVAAVIGICCSVTLWYMSIDTSNKTVREIADELLKL
jgi:hypothetical protein